MKPIFNQEKKFLEMKLGVDLPNDCWRSGSKIYLNHFDKKPFLTFKVDLLKNQINIKKYEVPTHQNYTLEEEYELAKDILEEKVSESINRTKEYILQHKDTHRMFVSISGGKDSDVMKNIVDSSMSELLDEGINVNYKLMSFNTSNDSAETYLHLKNTYGLKPAIIENNEIVEGNMVSPELGYYQWIIKKKNYFTPSRFVRNCCSTYKEGQISKIMKKQEKTITFLGARSPESQKRKHYDFDLNKAHVENGGKLNVSESWERFLPIVKWTDAEVWLYILNRKIKYNDMYNMGFHRIGCLICPYQQDYIDMLIRYFYPLQWRRWVDILNKGHEIYGIEKRLKWDLLEWSEGGRWKNATSKEAEITNLKATPERIKELAELKGISEEMAVKYFKKECSCGKKMNPTEIAMFLKLTGRYEGIEDNRQYLCKKCLSEKLGITTKEYKEMSIEFVQGGCELF